MQTHTNTEMWIETLRQNGVIVHTAEEAAKAINQSVEYVENTPTSINPFVERVA